MVYALVGSNAFVRREKLAEITNEFIKKNGQQNIEYVSGETLTLQDLPQLLQGVSLFAANRLVVIRDLSGNKEIAEALMSQLQGIPDDTEIILTESTVDKRSSYYKALKKLAGFIECSELSEADTLTWVSRYIDQQGGKISVKDSHVLLRYVGIDQQRLVNEIEKLLAYSQEITEESIKELIEPRPQETAFQLIELALSSNKQQALQVLGALEAAFADPFQIANLLMWQIQVLAVVKSAGERSDAQIAKETKFNPYVISKTRRLARGVDSTKIRALLQEATELDVSLKTTSSDPWRLLEAVIIAL